MKNQQTDITMEIAEKIKKAFIEFVLENDKTPASVFVLVKKIKIKEEAFYEHFSSLANLESEIWLGFFEETKQSIEKEEVYPAYSVREKMLAFYYTLIEVWKANRSFILYSYRQKKKLDLNPAFLKDTKPAFKDFMENLVLEGREAGEIAERISFIIDAYPVAFWGQFLLVLSFWVKDDSKNFEKTDAFIEKIVNFSFDAIGKSSIDSALDLAKFVFQNR